MVSKHRAFEKSFETEIWVNGRKLPLNHFIQETVANTLVGFLKTLKEMDEPEKTIEIKIKKLTKRYRYFPCSCSGRSDVDMVIARMASYFNPKMIIPHHYDNFLPPVTIGSSYQNLVEEVKKINPNIVVNILDHEIFYYF